PPPIVGEGDAVASGDLVTVLGVGVGFGATVRPRLDEELVLVFWAITKIAHAKSTEAATRNLFMRLAPSSELTGLLKFVPRALAAQAHGRTFAPHYLKHVKH